MIKKLLVIIAVLGLIAGTAYAADLNDGLTKQVWAQAKGRSVVSDGSVALRIWYVGSGAGAVSVSANSIRLYHNGTETAVNYSTYGTAEKVVEYIDGLGNWEALLGPDARPGTLFFGPTNITLASNAATAGTSKTNPSYVYQDSSTIGYLSAGIEPTDGKYNRIKSVTSKFATNPTNGIVSLLIYDGDTLVWRKDITATAGVGYNLSTAKDCSPDTVSFVDKTDKGLAGSMGKSLIAVVSGSTAVTLDYPMTTDKLTDHNISIVYDQF